MKRLVLMGMVAAAACAFAEEQQSLFGRLCSAPVSDAEAVSVSAEAKKDATISKLLQQINDLKAKIDSAADASSSQIDKYNGQLKDLKEKLRAKVDAFKAEQQKKLNEAKAKREAERAKAKNIETNATGLVSGILDLFK